MTTIADEVYKFTRLIGKHIVLYIKDGRELALPPSRIRAAREVVEDGKPMPREALCMTRPLGFFRRFEKAKIHPAGVDTLRFSVRGRAHAWSCHLP